ncbi:hypothetical protein D3C71_2172910 [compost metagenome]
MAFCNASASSKVAEGLTPLNPVAFARLMMPAEDKAARNRPKPAAATKTKAVRSSSRTIP